MSQKVLILDLDGTTIISHDNRGRYHIISSKGYDLSQTGQIVCSDSSNSKKKCIKTVSFIRSKAIIKLLKRYLGDHREVIIMTAGTWERDSTLQFLCTVLSDVLNEDSLKKLRRSKFHNAALGKKISFKEKGERLRNLLNTTYKGVFPTGTQFKLYDDSQFHLCSFHQYARGTPYVFSAIAATAAWPDYEYPNFKMKVALICENPLHLQQLLAAYHPTWKSTINPFTLFGYCTSTSFLLESLVDESNTQTKFQKFRAIMYHIRENPETSLIRLIKGYSCPNKNFRVSF